MVELEEAAKLATMAIPGPGPDERAVRAFDGMPIAELALVWCALQRVSLRDTTAGTWDAVLYFDRLPHDDPERTFELMLEALRSQTDKSVLMQLNNKMTPALLYAHGPKMIERIEAEAQTNDRLRWLIGGVYWWGSDEALKARLERIADIPGWEADKTAHDTPAKLIHFECLSTEELARVWVEQHCKLEKDRDNNWSALADYERDLREDNPDRALDLILAVLLIESNPVVLSVLAAGPLEDLISMAMMDRFEGEAATNPQFKELLGGVWYSRQSEEIQSRLNAILARR